MPEATVKPNVISFDAAIGACEKGGQRQMALILLEEMRIAGCNISS
jgi:pentatricopeptide repeat domain-containing protein 1